MNAEERNKTSDLWKQAKEKKRITIRGGEEEVLLESQGYETDKVDDWENRRRGEKLKIAYTNVNGLQSALVEINDYLRVERPDVMGITETKLTEVFEENKIGEGEYNTWVRNRAEKQGGGMILLVKKDFVAYELRNDYGLAEVVGAEVVCGGVKRDFVVIYAPPKPIHGIERNIKGRWRTQNDG
ncbi:hypothetical protein E2C01_097695 [Portunus trituberculatus]|uniref:Endonuclease/exonuclease/phosphatase domain-containing protein n=1 Tax=Portunus trituberculatus TaxID=210409 RepID=A0A5B7K5I1_PORTR|nr:hypothetical protein [Portunus trituberculatus]